MEKDKVESRTHTEQAEELATIVSNIYESESDIYYERSVEAIDRWLAARPSVPKQGQGRWRIDGEKKFLLKKDGSEIGPTEATACEMELWNALAASRSEAQPPDPRTRCTKENFEGFRCRRELGHWLACTYEDN